jgi:hypothetical protein
MRQVVEATQRDSLWANYRSASFFKIDSMKNILEN